MRTSLASACVLVALLACRSDKPEDQVRAAFEACRVAVEAGDAATAIAPLDPAFRGPEGLDKATARMFLLGTFRQEKIGVTVLRNEVVVRGSEALQEVELVLTGRSGGLLPQDASQRGYRLRWRQAGGAWKLMDLQPLDGR
jgi:ketosteroid isomerase-like protein